MVPTASDPQNERHLPTCRVFRQTPLYGARNRLQIGVYFSLLVVGFNMGYRNEHSSARIMLDIPTCY
jgi:hypothetical protein